VVGTCEHGDEHSGSLQGGKFDHLTDKQLLKNEHISPRCVEKTDWTLRAGGDEDGCKFSVQRTTSFPKTTFQSVCGRCFSR
jgi:hypothetical protein